MMISPIQSGVQGLQRAERQFERVAQDRISISGGDPVEDTVSSIRAVAAYRANLKSIQTADEVSGVVISLSSARD
jgi:flagellar basal body rod protein FlgG